MEKRQFPTAEPKAGGTWEHLEDFVREHVQQFIQALLEQKVLESSHYQHPRRHAQEISS